MMRFIVLSNVTDYLEAMTVDDALFQMRQQGIVPDTLLLIKPPQFIFVPQRSSLLYVDRDYAEAHGFPVARSATVIGRDKSTFVISSETWNMISSVSETEDHFQKFGYGVWEYVCNTHGLPVEQSGNDLQFLGTTRKVSGLAYSTANSVVHTNISFSNALPDVDLTKILKVDGVSERVTSFKKEKGIALTVEQIVDSVTAYFDSIGIELRRDTFTEAETAFAASLRAKHQSEEWLRYGTYEKQPDFQ